LRWLNQEATGGGGTVHSQVDTTTRALVIANYHTGYVAAVPIGADGRVGPRSAYFPHEGVAPLGPNRTRQDRPHPHCIILSPDNRFAYSCDLGQDRIYCYRLDPAHATLQPNDPPFGIAEPGSGPRHGVFSPDGKYLYVANELNGTVTLYRHDAPRGALTLVQSYSTLPEGFSGENTVGEIDLHPNGKYLYVSNRGHDSIAVFARDPASGRLERKEIVGCGGKHPRTFTVAPNGRWLLCGNKDTNSVVVFAVDPGTGRITATGREVSVPEVVCVLIV
jgi:6-phosphogluconolactonase